MAGVSAALGAAGIGARVVLVNPSGDGGGQRLLHHYLVVLNEISRAASVMSEFSSQGIVDPVRASLNFAELHKEAVRRRDHELAQSVVAPLAALGVESLNGHGEFNSESSVLVNGNSVAFSRAIIATGRSQVKPAIPGAENASVLTPQMLPFLSEMPKRIAVIGSGGMACEIAQIYCRLGSKVTVWSDAALMMPELGVDASSFVCGKLAKEDVVFHLGSTGLRIDPKSVEVMVSGSSGGELLSESFDKVISVSPGVPNLQDLHVERAGIELSGERLDLNDFLMTTNRRVFAAGSVCQTNFSIHAAEATARVAISNAMLLGRTRLSELVMPRLVMTDPEIAEIGVTTTEAEQRGLKMMTIPLGTQGAAGFVKLLHDRHGAIRGATVVAPGARETAGEFAVLIGRKVKLSSVAGDIHAIPSVSDAIRRAGEVYRRSLLTPFIASLIKRLINSRK